MLGEKSCDSTSSMGMKHHINHQTWVMKPNLQNWWNIAIFTKWKTIMVMLYLTKNGGYIIVGQSRRTAQKNADHWEKSIGWCHFVNEKPPKILSLGALESGFIQIWKTIRMDSVLQCCASPAPWFFASGRPSNCARRRVHCGVPDVWNSGDGIPGVKPRERRKRGTWSEQMVYWWFTGDLMVV